MKCAVWCWEIYRVVNRLLGYQFRINNKQISNVVQEAALSIVRTLRWEHFNNSNTSHMLLKTSQYSKQHWNFPNELGAVDRKYIVLEQPKMFWLPLCKLTLSQRVSRGRVLRCAYVKRNYFLVIFKTGHHDFKIQQMILILNRSTWRHLGLCWRGNILFTWWKFPSFQLFPAAKGLRIGKRKGSNSPNVNDNPKAWISFCWCGNEWTKLSREEFVTNFLGTCRWNKRTNISKPTCLTAFCLTNCYPMCIGE